MLNFANTASRAVTTLGDVSWLDSDSAKTVDKNNATYLGANIVIVYQINGYHANMTMTLTLATPRPLHQVDFRYQKAGSVPDSKTWAEIILHWAGGGVAGYAEHTVNGATREYSVVSTGQSWYGKKITDVVFRIGNSGMDPYVMDFVNVLLTAYFYEMRLWIPDRADSGLRFYSGSTRKIAKFSDATESALKIRKGANTINLSLVATGDEFASPIRIRKGSTTYALEEYW